MHFFALLYDTLIRKNEPGKTKLCLFKVMFCVSITRIRFHWLPAVATNRVDKRLNSVSLMISHAWSLFVFFEGSKACLAIRPTTKNNLVVLECFSGMGADRRIFFNFNFYFYFIFFGLSLNFPLPHFCLIFFFFLYKYFSITKSKIIGMSRI